MRYADFALQSPGILFLLLTNKIIKNLSLTSFSSFSIYKNLKIIDLFKCNVRKRKFHGDKICKGMKE